MAKTTITIDQLLTPERMTPVERPVFTLMRDGPFVLGGRHNWHPVGTRVPTTGPFPMGRGYQGLLVTAPNGKTFVAEASSGAFVGSDLIGVATDIHVGDPAVMKRQVAEAREMAASISWVDPDTFWARLKCRPGEPGLHE